MGVDLLNLENGGPKLLPIGGEGDWPVDLATPLINLLRWCRTDARITPRGCLAHPSPALRDQPTLRPASYPPEWLEKELRNPFD
jgi:hypothetical protein